MATLEQRLAKLEAAKARGGSGDPQQVAMGRLADALFEALPDDELEFVTTGFVRRAVYPPAYRTAMDKLRDLAGRIEAGDLSDEDSMLLEGLPQDPALDMTPAEFITTMISGLDKLY